MSRQPRACPSSGRLKSLVLFPLVALALTFLTGCTRDDVASTIATVVVQLEATLVPLGATAQSGAEALGTRIPAAFATAKLNATGSPESGEIALAATPTPAVMPSSTATAVPLATSTVTRETAPAATATEEPSATAMPTPTMTPPPTPLAQSIEVPGGSMNLVRGGFFQMGAVASAMAEECNRFREGCLSEWFAASEPIHAIFVDYYYIDSTEVTNAAFVNFLNTMGEAQNCSDFTCLDLPQSRIVFQDGAYSSPAEFESFPVTGVTWFGADSYCSWRGARLPTEAEWEKAAAWDPDAFVARRYPWGDEFNGQLTNFCDASCAAPQANGEFNDSLAEEGPVASFADGTSATGLFDMGGNVWEWVQDWFDPAYYAASILASNPTGPVQGTDKVVRGGSWFDTGNFTSAAIRFPSAPLNSDKTIGFRCAADIPSSN